MLATAVSHALLTPGEKNITRVQICCGEKLFAVNKMVTFIRFVQTAHNSKTHINLN